MSARPLADLMRPVFRAPGSFRSAHLRGPGRTDVIQLDYGQPFPDSIPTLALAHCTARALEDEGWTALRYGGGPSVGGLREYLAAWSAGKGIKAESTEVLVTTGSMQAIDIIALVLLEAGDAVMVEAPTYFTALRRFAAYGADIHGFTVDDQGLCSTTVAKWLETRRLRGEPPPKLLYTIANFQNPTGYTLSLQRRRQLLELAYEYGFVIVEDDAYGDLYFQSPPPPAFRALDPQGAHTIYVSTLSKTIAPGLRLGWVIAEREMVSALQRAKGDGGTSPFTQALALSFLRENDFAGRVAWLRSEYARRWSLMEAALARELPPGVRWTRPEGGFFTWLDLPDATDMDALERAAQGEGVTYVAGVSFFTPERAVSSLRLCFSFCEPDQLSTGVGRLAAAIAAASG